MNPEELRKLIERLEAVERELRAVVREAPVNSPELAEVIDAAHHALLLAVFHAWRLERSATSP